jgi:hypothetical protein
MGKGRVQSKNHALVEDDPYTIRIYNNRAIIHNCGWHQEFHTIRGIEWYTCPCGKTITKDLIKKFYFIRSLIKFNE